MIKKLICYFKGHKWTCSAQKGIPATPEQLTTYNGFKDYAKMYCDRCGHTSRLNKRFL